VARQGGQEVGNPIAERGGLSRQLRERPLEAVPDLDVPAAKGPEELVVVIADHR
jgi:hypothetical protein